jgi:hypothetical protein
VKSAARMPPHKASASAAPPISLKSNLMEPPMNADKRRLDQKQ